MNQCRCLGYRLYEVIPDIPEELKRIENYKYVQGQELSKYARDNVSNYIHNFASEDTHYSGIVGIYPCPYCFREGEEDATQKR